MISKIFSKSFKVSLGTSFVALSFFAGATAVSADVLSNTVSVFVIPSVTCKADKTSVKATELVTWSATVLPASQRYDYKWEVESMAPAGQTNLKDYYGSYSIAGEHRAIVTVTPILNGSDADVAPRLAKRADCNGSVTVTTSGAQPDLIPRGLENSKPIKLAGPTYYTPGTTQDFSFQLTPENIGASFSQKFPLLLQKKVHGSTIDTYSKVTETISGGGLNSASYTYINISGSFNAATLDKNSDGYDFRYCVDLPNGTVSESNENNNCSGDYWWQPANSNSNTFSVSCYPNVTSVDIAHNPPDEVTWTAQVNGGVPPYTFTWSGNLPLTGTFPNINDTKITKTVTYENSDQNPKYGRVAVTDSSVPVQTINSKACSSAVQLVDSSSNFGLSVNPVSTSMKFVGQGASTFPVKVWVSNPVNFTDVVTISAENKSLPAYIVGKPDVPLTYEFYKDSGLTQKVSGQLMPTDYAKGLYLVIKAAKQIKGGSYPVKIFGIGGAKTHDVTINLNIQVIKPVFEEI